MAFTNIREKKRTAKILFIGPTGAGKTYPGLQMERPIGAFDGEDGLRAFRDVFDFDVDPFDTIEELNEKVRGVLRNGQVLGHYNTFLVDGLTVAWHAGIRQASGGNGTIQMKDQNKLKGPWKEFNELVYQLGKRDKNVWATVQAKANWDIKPGQKPKFLGMTGDVNDKIWYAFDLVCYIEVVNGVRTVSILKSRYPNLFRIGDTIENFDAKTHFAPIFEGSAPAAADESEPEAAEVEGGEAAEKPFDIAEAKGEIERTLRKLGSKSKGGQVADEDARRLYLVATRSQNPAEVQAGLEEIRKLDGDGQQAA